MGRYAELKARHRDERAGWPQPFSHRIHRALSWLNRAEQMLEAELPDHDSGFILLWVSFNAAYAEDVRGAGNGERASIGRFLGQLAVVDRDRRLHDAIWVRFSQEIQVLLGNRFVFHPFWQAQRGVPINWQAQMQRANDRALQALDRGAVPDILGVVFDRLYTLRNQLVHGGATWNGNTNRAQLRDACAIMGWLMPLVIELMMAAPQQDWGTISYPVLPD